MDLLSISAAHKMTRGSCTSQKCIIARPRPLPCSPERNAFGGNAEVCVPRPPGRRKKPVGSVRVRTSPCFSQVLGLICMHSPFWRYPPPSSLISFSNYAPLFVLCRRTAGFPSQRSDVLRDAIRGRGRPAAPSRVVGHLASLMRP